MNTATKTSPQDVHLEHSDMGTFFDYTLEDYKNNDTKYGRVFKSKLKEYYERTNYGYWWMQLDDQTDIVDGVTPYLEFMCNADEDKINDLIVDYLIDSRLV